MNRDRYRFFRNQFGVLLAGMFLMSACISAPNVVLVDQKTALEQQAAGEFNSLAGELERAGSIPKAEEIPGSKLQQPGSNGQAGRLGEVAQLYSVERDDAQRIDQLLLAQCVGEASDGTLRQTPERCKMDVDGAQIARLVERTNLHRRQLWSVLQSLAPDSTEEQVRSAWRTRHLKRVVCGGLIQEGQKAWEPKKC